MSNDYRGDLRKEIKTLKRDIAIKEEKIEELLQEGKVGTEEFESEYKELNDLRLSLKTKRSRLENIGHFPPEVDHSGLFIGVQQNQIQ